MQILCICNLNYVHIMTFSHRIVLKISVIHVIHLTKQTFCYYYCHNNHYNKEGNIDMQKEKCRRLERDGTLHPQPQKVTAGLISKSVFFDPKDLMQMKYEMLRAVNMNEESITDAAHNFGLSRVAFYHAKEQYQEGGLVGLLPGKRGPKSPHKLSQEVLTFIYEQMETVSGNDDWEEISRKVEVKFNIKIHPRSIRRAVKDKKNGKHKQA